MPYLNTAHRTAGSFKQIPYWRLRAKFREQGLYDEEIAALAGITLPTMGRRMRGVAPWTSDEIVAVARVVGIAPEQVGLYFFPELTEENENAPAD